MGIVSFDIKVSVTDTDKTGPRWTLDRDLNGEISLAQLLHFSKNALISISTQVLREEQARGFPKDPVVVVDNKVGKSPLNVHPLGSIEYIARGDMTQIIRDTFDAIIERSPIDTGKYISSHLVFLNGTQVAYGQNSLEQWLSSKPNIKVNDLIRFVNVQPYARRLERLGVTAQRRTIRTQKSRDSRQRSGHKGRILAPNGVYYLVHRSIKRKYKNLAGIKFGFVSGTHLGVAGNFKKKASAGSKPSRYLYPTITRLANGGTL